MNILNETDLIYTVGATGEDSHHIDGNNLRTVLGGILLNAVSPLLNFITVPVSRPNQQVEIDRSSTSRIDRNLLLNDRY
ncbi:hypothetical protein ACFQU1_23325 [Chelatococcus sp. GCM10030263]|uniref:hypothetical protein n=1 Tax=Chelatococcus sp. GCM10030263 TaxID=3273387 RepID=UPI00361AD27B